MPTTFGPLELRAAHDRARLVPFTGSGMSVPACGTWHSFVERLEQLAGTYPSPRTAGATGGQLSEQALVALRTLRRSGVSLPDAVRLTLYDPQVAEPPANAMALAAEAASRTPTAGDGSSISS